MKKRQRRKVAGATLAILAVAVLSSAWLAFAAPSISSFKVLRAKANLAASTACTTSSISCLGAQQVAFFIRTADRVAARPGNTMKVTPTAQVSNDGANWVNVPTTYAVSGVEVITNSALDDSANGGGKVIQISPGSKTGTPAIMNQYIPWGLARLVFAAVDSVTDSLYVIGYTLDNGGTDLQRARKPGPR